MGIPKVIHYCWFGGAPLPASVKKCIASWRKYCPDYQIVRWDEHNFDVNACKFSAEAYARGMWAFVSDYARLKIVYEQGGIYLDTDVELLKPLDFVLSSEGFMAFQNDRQIATGLGFGAEQGQVLIGKILKNYEQLSFVKEDGKLDMEPCPQRDTDFLRALGMKADGEKEYFEGITFFPSDYFSPMDWESGKCAVKPCTVAIHHCDASWLSGKEKYWLRVRRVVGTARYEQIRRSLEGVLHLLGKIRRALR